MFSIFGNTIDMTQRSMDYLWTKQSITAHNISNNDTPGYKAQYVTFEDALKSNLKSAAKSKFVDGSSMSKAIRRSDFKIHDTEDSARLDGNNVQIEAENTELVRSYLQYQYQIQSINSDFTQLATAIKGQ